MSLNVGARTFLVSKDEFARVERTNLLGLQGAPVMVLDDDTSRVAVVGNPLKTDLVLAATGKTLEDVPVSVPVDVRTIGIAQLTAHGTSAEVQGLMFTNWRTKLTPAQRAQYTQEWAAASAGTPAETSAFLDAMIAGLSNL